MCFYGCILHSRVLYHGGKGLALVGQHPSLSIGNKKKRKRQLDLDKMIAKLKYLDSGGSELKWVEGFNIGSVVDGKIEEVKDIGVVIGFKKYNDVFGFVTHYQLGGIVMETGSTIQAVVLDVDRAERLVDLSLRPEFVNGSKEGSSVTQKKKRKNSALKDLEVFQSVNATVEIVRENYLVLSIPEYNYAIGYASVYDYNTQRLPQRQFLDGQSVIATVMALPCPETSGRLLLLLNEVNETSSSKRAKKMSSYEVGSLVQAEITEIKPLELKLKFGIGLHGRVHITEVNNVNDLEDPFVTLKVGKTVQAVILAKANRSNSNRNNFQWELSMRPELLTGSYKLGDELMTEKLEFSTGQCVTGYVYKVESEWVWLTISRNVRAQLYVLDSACEPSELKDFQKRFYVGKPVSGYVLSINRQRKLLRVIFRPFSALSCGNGDNSIVKLDDHENSIVNDNSSDYIHEGDIVGGRISKVFPGVSGLLVQIGPHMYGRINYTDLTDSWVPDPLSGYHEGQFVKCKVLEVSRTVSGNVHVDLSLQSSDGMLCQNSTEVCNVAYTPSKRVEKIDDLHPDMVVQGYVKNVTPKGCFILLSRKIDAKILLSNLSDGYVKDPEQEFPVGKLVIGRVLSVEPLSNRVEVTLKSSNASSRPESEINSLSTLHVGHVISGRIKRVESYGLFIAIDNTTLVGLCHISEISDDHIENIETKYRAGEKVTARVLK
ncbi:rRNA biogenesis protein rrp5 [Quillaja saponaria]|uniref:rRNA biogenesis protein rrp5 n=1 Tax=Quillaja saponaria TaxID=32244 RepID=A0AAD7VHF0_QUISA|nr:rRNA biogenesis protein rrp5 [Quillaja saponaria]